MRFAHFIHYINILLEDGVCSGVVVLNCVQYIRHPVLSGRAPALVFS